MSLKPMVTTLTPAMADGARQKSEAGQMFTLDFQKCPNIMAKYAEIESMGGIRSITVVTLEVQVDGALCPPLKKL